VKGVLSLDLKEVYVVVTDIYVEDTMSLVVEGRIGDKALYAYVFLWKPPV
jgi:hypothetical protein